MRLHMRVATLCVLTVATLAACSDGAGVDAGTGVRAVTSNAILADLAETVAAPDARVSSLVPRTADLHSFEPTTETARAVSRAQLIVLNGYGLEGRLLDVIAENRAGDAAVVVASAGIDPLEGGEPEHEAGGAGGTPSAKRGDLPPLALAEGDPHMWLDPRNAAAYVENIAAALAAADPAHADGYRARGAARSEALRALHAELSSELASVPPARRKIVAFHDAFQYFARAFDFELVASVLPAAANQEASAAHVADVVRLVRSNGVPAIYTEPQFSSQTLDLVARETGARVLALYSDAFGPGVESYDQLLRANASALLEGLGGTVARPAPRQTAAQR